MSQDVNFFVRHILFTLVYSVVFHVYLAEIYYLVVS